MRLFRRGEVGTSVDLLVAGLGNPGSEHARDRHNVGWMVVDELARRHSGSFKGKFRGRLADVRVGDAKLALLKPETYMNESGASIQAAAAFYKTPIDQVLVVHDDVDLELARLRRGRVARRRGARGDAAPVQLRAGAPGLHSFIRGLAPQAACVAALLACATRHELGNEGVTPACDARR